MWCLYLPFRDAHVGLNLLLPVGFGLHHSGLVNVVLVQAVALERALSGIPLGSRAVTGLLVHLGHGGGQQLLVVGG